MVITSVNIKEITVGDTVIHNGVMRTVCRRAFSHDNFVGLMLWGDSYNMGSKLVERVTFPVFYEGEVIK